MMTPKQRIFFESNPSPGTRWLRELVERLDAVPVESQEFKMNGKIAERVGSWVDQMGMAPVRPRVVRKDPGDRKPWDEVDLSHIPKGTVPF